jgi:regulator of sigma E protease
MFLTTIIKLLLILGVVATIHEFGHFLAAKLFNIGVNEFSVGFGPKIVQKKFKGTMYSLRWIPLGGYCAIEGEEGKSESETSFGNKSTFKKILVLSMGVIFNTILAIIIFLAVALSYPTNTTTIESFANDSILEKAGLQVGDTIYSINDKKTKFKSQIMDVRNLEKDDVQIEYIRNGKTEKVIIDNAVSKIGYIGASFVINGNSDNTNIKSNNQIDLVASGSAAKKAGLKANDIVLSIDSVDVSTPNEIIALIRQHPNETIKFKIKRGNEILEKEVTTSSKRYFDVGVLSTTQVKTTIPLSFESASNNIKNVVNSYIDLFKGKVSINEMSGIVGIGEIVSKTNGFLEFLNLMGIISLAIGVANIMPFPPLDGGKIVIVLGEAITKRKISEKTEAIISYIGFGLLILLTLVVTYNDIVRIF